MWCGHCQQDVPAVAATGDGQVHCARCQRQLARPDFASVTDSGPALDASAKRTVSPEPTAVPRRIDADKRYRRIGQTLRSAKRRAAPVRSDHKMLRFDPAEQQPAFRATPRPLRQIVSESAKPPRDPHQSSQAVAWLIALVGATILGAGLGLIGWALLGPKPELWNWGLFGTLGGQGLLVVGLTLLLANLWTSARTSSGRLATMQNELLRLQRSTEALTGDRTATATRFYADLARGASPELLVANLRGQLDELSASISHE